MTFPRAILWERHGWRRPSQCSDLFDHAFVLGFVTVYLSKKSIADRLADLRDALEMLRDGK